MEKVDTISSIKSEKLTVLCHRIETIYLYNAYCLASIEVKISFWTTSRKERRRGGELRDAVWTEKSKIKKIDYS